MTHSVEHRIEQAARTAGAAAVAVALHDLSDGREIAVQADRWFHAASTIKLAVLLALYDAIERGALAEDARVHVRNQFISAADGRYYRVEASRDGNQAVHRYVGRTMRIRDLARHMIVTSSNLATNVLVELLGPDAIRVMLRRYDLAGIRFRRGVEDERAWEAGLNNQVTARGLMQLLRLIVEERAVSESASRQMLEVLHDQRFIDGIPAGLPDGTRVANKTGEISTVAHDAGVVYLADREPYVLVVLTEWPTAGDVDARRALIAETSRLVAEALPGEVYG